MGGAKRERERGVKGTQEVEYSQGEGKGMARVKRDYVRRVESGGNCMGREGEYGEGEGMAWGRESERGCGEDER